MKKCTKCGVLKPLDMFNKSSASKDGHQYYCRSCNKERIKAWRVAHPNYDKAWYDANREHRNEYHKAWYIANREHRKEYIKAWRDSKCIW